MKNKTKRIIIYFLIELIYTLIMLGYLIWLRTNYSISNEWEMPLFIIINIILIMMIWIIGPMLNRYFIFIYTGLITLYLVAQNIYHKAFNQYFRINTAISLSKEVMEVKSSINELIEAVHIKPFVILTIVTIVFVMFYFLLQRKCFKLIYRIPYKLLCLLLIVPIVNQYNNFNLMLDEARHQEDAFQLNKTDFYIYDTIPNTNQFVDKFGLITFAYRDTLSFYEQDLISHEDYIAIEEFLNTRKPHSNNEMTGLFEGKNVIMIQAESFMDVAIDEILTPTLYKMKNEGINIKNFNTPALPGSTSDTEFMSNTSLIPSSEGYAICYKYPFNTYKTTLATIFNDLGYRTLAFHNNYGQYYNRNVVFPNLGYQKFYDCTELGLEDEASDKDVMEVLKWIFVESKTNYLAYWITYSGHQPYNLDSVGVEEKNVNIIKQLYPNLEDGYVAYMAKNMELDQALNTLVTELEKVKKLDDVVFVFYGDHIVKGLDYDSNAYYETVGKTKQHNSTYTDLFFYNSATSGFEYDKVSTTLDLLPTIANLWNIEIDTKTILGRDIFDETYDGFYFSEWEFWKTDNYMYDFINDKLYIENGYDESYAENEMKYYLNMKEMSKKILKLNYFGE